jgi:hypothetical protein
MKYVVDVRAVEGFTDVEFSEFEARFVLEMGKVAHAAGEQIINGYDGVAVRQQCVTEVGTQESGAAGH